MTASSANQRCLGGWCSSAIGWQNEGAAQKQRSVALGAQKLPAEITGSEAKAGGGKDGKEERDRLEGKRLEKETARKKLPITLTESQMTVAMRTERDKTMKAKKYK